MIIIDGENLTPEKVMAVARDLEEVSLSGEALLKVQKSRQSLMNLVNSGRKIYGVNTGFGSLLNVAIKNEDVVRLQSNLIRSHASGFGERLSDIHVRAMMIVRANSLCKGFSGVRPELIEMLIFMLNRRIHPVVPRFGSVGASGDLAPLAHVALAMMGEGLVTSGTETRDSGEVLAEAGIGPFSFREKEGVAFINGTSTISGILAVEFVRSLEMFQDALSSAALSFEGLRGTYKAFTSWAVESRGHPGQKLVAEIFRNALKGSRNIKNASTAKVQDPYTLRCIPQVYGAVLDTLEYARKVITIEINSVTDNPLINGDEYVSVGNFHGEPVAFVSDFLAIALTDLGNMIERRLARITDSNLSGLPAFLIQNSGFNSGYMIPQYTAAALCNRNKVLCTPSSADSIPTSANQEDHVSMGTNAAIKLIEINDNLEGIVAIEYLLASQAIEFIREPISDICRKLHGTIRESVPELLEDRPPSVDIGKIVGLMRTGILRKDAGRFFQN